MDDLIRSLNCHLCGGQISISYKPPFSNNSDFAIASCKCREYPIVDGILMYKQHPASALVMANIRNSTNDYQLRISVLPFINEKVVRFLVNITLAIRKYYPKWKGLTFWKLATFITDSRWATYVKYRFSAPSLISGLALIPAIKKASEKGRILDFGCGFGHLSFLISRQIGAEKITCADRDFINLYFTKNYLLGGKADYICLDGNEPLPFIDGSFAGIVSMDCFHYIDKKETLSKELMRSLKKNGLMVFIHLHNVNIRNISQGLALTPEGYQALFDPLRSMVFPEDHLLGIVFGGGKLDLGQTFSSTTLSGMGEISMIVSGDGGYFSTYESYFDLTGTSANEKTILNPLYRKKRGKYARVFPSDFYEEEYAKIKGYFPPVADERLPETELIQKLILIPVPENYKKKNEQTSIRLWR